MDKLLELLFRQPMILVFVVIWLIGMVSNALKAQKKVRERREAATRPQPMHPQAVHPQPVSSERSSATMTGDRSATAERSMSGRAVGGDRPGAYARNLGTGERKEMSQQSQADVAMRSRTQQPIAHGTASDQSRPLQSSTAVPPQTGRKSPEQIAREMRQLLGLEPDERVVPEATRTAPPPIRQQTVVIDPETIRANAAEVPMQQHIKSHVGESLRDRHMSKTKVGQSKARRGAALGNLGGRVRTASKPAPLLAPSQRRYAMDDLRRVIVMNEILSPPVALRPDSHRLL